MKRTKKAEQIEVKLSLVEIEEIDGVKTVVYKPITTSPEQKKRNARLFKSILEQPKPMFAGLWDKMRMIQKAAEPMAGLVSLQKSILEQTNAFKVTGSPLLKPSPLFEYGNQLNVALEKWAVTPIGGVNDGGALDRLIRDQKTAEDNYYHQFIVSDYERDLKRLEQKKEELAVMLANEREKTRNLENLIKCAVRAYVQPSPTKKQSTKLTIRPNITFSQITELKYGLDSVFDASIEQWRNLFAEEIIIFDTPIDVRSSFKSDPRVLLHFLFKKELVGSNKYPSILEKTKAFQFRGEVLTAKKINAPKEYSNYPYIGNATLIEQVVDKITN